MTVTTQQNRPSPSAPSARKRIGMMVSSSAAIAGAAWLMASAAQAATAASAPTPPLSFGECTDMQLPPEIAPRAQCGSITVQENRERPNGRTITLPVFRILSSGKTARDPVFVLNGGPGDANIDTIRPAPLMSAQHDIYYVGYRGADGASAMTCPEFGPPLAAPRLFDAQARENIALAGKACAARLRAAGFDLTRYTMFDVIDDLEQVRAAIGAARVNLFSVSYGTRLAQYYARRHPGSIARSAMFAVNPPGHFVFSAHVNDQVLDRLTILCAADSFCASRTSDLGATLRAALKAGERSGNPAIDDARTQLALFQTLYGRASTAMFIAAAIEAEKGNLEPLAQGAKLVDGGLKNVIYGDLFSKGSLDLYHYPALLPSFAATDRSMGSPFDIFYMTASKYWPVAPVPAGYDRAAYDPTPTLLVNGDIDLSTPLLFVQAELMPYLPNGKLVVFKDYGHSDFGRQRHGLDVMVTRFYADGTVDTSAIKDDPYRFGPEE